MRVQLSLDRPLRQTYCPSTRCECSIVACAVLSLRLARPDDLPHAKPLIRQACLPRDTWRPLGRSRGAAFLVQAAIGTSERNFIHSHPSLAAHADRDLPADTHPAVAMAAET